MTVELNELNWQEFPLFYGLDESVARRFLSMGFQFRYEAGALMVSNNDQGETFFMLMKGLAKLVLKNSQGEFVNVTLFRTGDFFGELSIMEPNTVRNGDILAVNDVEVITIHKKDFLKIMQDCPMLSFNLARCLGQRLRTMNERIVTHQMPDDVHKVAHTLLTLAKKGKSFEQEGTVLLPPLSLKEWALFCSTGGDVFMDSIEDLKQQGALEWQNQRIVVTDMGKLKACAQVYLNRVSQGQR